MNNPIPATTGAIWSRNFILLSLSNALLFGGFHFLLPTLPLFSAAYGATSAQIGLIVGGFTFSAIAARFIAPYGIQRWGYGRFLLMGLIVCIISMAGYYFTAQATSTLIIRLAHGIGFGIASTLYATLAAELVPSSRRGEGMGYFTLGATFAMALAPLFGLWLYECYQAEGLFLAGTAVQFLAFLIVLLIHKPLEATAVAEPADTAGSFPIRPLLIPCFLSLLLGISMGGVMSFITLLAQEHHFANPGLFFLISASSVFLVRTFSGRIYDRLGAPYVIGPAAFFLVLAMVLLSSNKPSFLLAAALYGIALGALFPALQTWLLQLAPPDKKSIANATFYNSLDIGVGGGSFILGFVAGDQSFAAVYRVTTYISMALLATYLLYLWRISSQSSPCSSKAQNS